MAAKKKPSVSRAPLILVDSTGGAASATATCTTIVAPGANATTSLTADMTAVQNAISTIIVALNILIAQERGT